MDTSDSEGLGLSLAIYVAAIACVFVLIAVPVYWANGPTVYDNPPLARSGPLMNGPIVGRQVSSAVPLVMLKRQASVDPAILAGVIKPANIAGSTIACRFSMTSGTALETCRPTIGPFISGPPRAKGGLSYTVGPLAQ